MTPPTTAVDRSNVLVDTAWLTDHLDDPALVLLEVDDRPALYHRGHPPGARLVNWAEDLQDPVRRDLPDHDAIAALWHRLGIRPDFTVVLYGDLHNWLAAYGYWLFASYGLPALRLLDGGRQHWISQGLPLTTQTPPLADAGQIPTPRFSADFRADRAHVDDAARAGSLLDVRTPQEYTGEWLTEPEFPGEAAHRPGHIPGAVNLPWDTTVNPDGHLKTNDELTALCRDAGTHRNQSVVTYCGIGERSAHTWIVLHELLQHPNVRNYDGSWTEWGSMTGMPIQLGPKPGELPAADGKPNPDPTQ